MKIRVLAVVGVVVGVHLFVGGMLTGCNAFGGRFGRGAPGDTFTDTAFTPSRAQAEERLREIVRAHIEEAQRQADSQRAPVVQRRPYFFREYEVYPDGLDGFTVDFREIDSQTRPLMAEVRMNKIRYSTRMHRRRERAETDTDFLRDTGEETLVYELRGGRWSRTGAIFDAHKTEEMINGEWVPRREETLRVIPSEDRPGWFRRQWLRVRGGEE